MKAVRAAAVALCLAAPAGAQAAAIDCGKAPPGIEQVICAHDDLLAGDRQLADAYARLRKACGGQAEQLRETQMFWLRDRNYCWNGPEITGLPIERCVAARMHERLDQFARIGPQCKLDAVAGEYRFIDPAYLARHGEFYVGRKVSVAGWPKLTSCNPSASDTRGYLMKGVNGKEGRIAIRFKSMPPLRREWVCAQSPFSHYTGVVQRDRSGFVLFLSDLLGEPL